MTNEERDSKLIRDILQTARRGSISSLFAIVDAHDDEIRRECTDSGFECMRINEGWDEDSVGWYRLKAAIMGEEVIK